MMKVDFKIDWFEPNPPVMDDKANLKVAEELLKVMPKERTYSIVFSITDPKSRLYSAKYMPKTMKDLSREEAFEIAKNIKKEIEQCKYFNLSFSWDDEEGKGTEAWRVSDEGCSQLLQIVRNDGRIHEYYKG